MKEQQPQQQKKVKQARRKAGEPHQALNWAFTFYPQTDEDIEAVKALASAMPKPYARLAFGEELCPTTGKRHLQGYVCFATKRTRPTVQRLFPRAGTNCAPVYSTVWHKEVYCSKDRQYWTDGIDVGDCPENEEVLKGDAKTVEILRLAKQGAWKELEERFPAAYLYQKGQLVRAFNDAIDAPDVRDGILDNVWICGRAGNGKDKLARTMLDNPFVKNATNKYWDGYAGQAHVWMRDVGKSLASFQDSFKDWTDRYKFAAEVKHATMVINPQRMVVTSQFMPEEIPGMDSETLEALERRFQFISVGDDGVAKRYPRVNVANVAVPIIVDVDEVRPRHAPKRAVCVFTDEEMDAQMNVNPCP